MEPQDVNLFFESSSLTFQLNLSNTNTTMADISVAEPPAPISTTAPETLEPNAEQTVATTGAADDTPQGDQQLQSVKKTKIIRRKKRPARIQVDPSTIKAEPAQQPGLDYNIWYNKSGDNDDKYGLSHPAPSRCNIARDSGYTRADRIPGSFFWYETLSFMTFKVILRLSRHLLILFLFYLAYILREVFA